MSIAGDGLLEVPLPTIGGVHGRSLCIGDHGDLSGREQPARYYLVATVDLDVVRS